MIKRKIIWGFLIMVMLGGSSLEMSCARKTSLQKRTEAYKRKTRKGKALPCPCDTK